MKKNILTMAVLLIASATVFTACSSDDEILNNQPVNPTEQKVYTMTIQATKGDNEAMTRALSLDGKTLSATWEQAEVVKVAQQDGSNNMIEVGELKVTQFTGNQATLTGTLTGVDAGKPLWFFLHHIDIDFTGQTGVLLGDENSIEQKYEHGVEGILNGNFTVDAEHNTISLGRALALPAQQAIVKFTLVDKADGTTPINAYCLTISDVSSEGSQLVTSYDFSTMTPSYGNLTVTPASPTNVLYVALSRNGSFDCRLTATIADGNEYTYTKTSVTFTAGKYYEVKVEMARKTALLSAATTADCGKVVCAAGHLHDAKTAVPSVCTAVGILGKVTETGNGLILALQDATSQYWRYIDSWGSVTTYAGTTLKVLPDDATRGSLTSYTTLGATTVSNWALAQKSDYEDIFINLGSTTGDDKGKTYDGNVNAYITTGVGGTAISGNYMSATKIDEDYGWVFFSGYWGYDGTAYEYRLRPVLGF